MNHSLTYTDELLIRPSFPWILFSQETVKMRDCTLSELDEEEELKEYNQCMKWFEECGKGFSIWYERKEDASKEEKKVFYFTFLIFYYFFF